MLVFHVAVVGFMQAPIFMWANMANMANMACQKTHSLESLDGMSFQNRGVEELVLLANGNGGNGLEPQG
jgi:hypothetical protein